MLKLMAILGMLLFAQPHKPSQKTDAAKFERPTQPNPNYPRRSSDLGRHK